jgi:hypothetical protein
VTVLDLGRTLVVASLLLAACAHSAPLTQAEYVAKAEAVCHRVQTQGAQLPAPAGPADLPAFLKHSVAITAQGLADLTALTRAYKDRAWVDKIFLTPLKGRLDAVNHVMPQVVAQSSQGRTDALDSLRLPNADLDAMGVFGFHECRKLMNSA